MRNQVSGYVLSFEISLYMWALIIAGAYLVVH